MDTQESRDKIILSFFFLIHHGEYTTSNNDIPPFCLYEVALGWKVRLNQTACETPTYQPHPHIPAYVLLIPEGPSQNSSTAHPSLTPKARQVDWMWCVFGWPTGVVGVCREIIGYRRLSKGVHHQQLLLVIYVWVKATRGCGDVATTPGPEWP